MRYKVRAYMGDAFIVREFEAGNDQEAISIAVAMVQFAQLANPEVSNYELTNMTMKRTVVTF